MNTISVYHQTDQQLLNELEVIQLAKKDPRQFEPLYRKYYTQIFRYVFNRVADKETAYDITSQVFLKALRNIERYEFRGVPFSSWLYRIAKSETYQSLRDSQKKRVVNVEPSNLADLALFVDDGEDKVLKEERIEKIFSALKQLNEHELQLIELRFFEHRSFREVAEILYLTENNAKVRCFRVIKKVKELLEK